MWRLIFLPILVMFLPCQAAYNPYCDPRWTGGVEYIGEYLKLRPCVCDLDYVISDPREYSATPGEDLYTLESLPSGLNQGADPERDNGFRIGVAAVLGSGCRDWTVTYAGLWTRDDQGFENPTPVNKDTGIMREGGIWPVFGCPRLLKLRLNSTSLLGDTGSMIRSATAKVGLRTHWSCGDGQVGWRWIRGCDLWLRGFVGIRGTFIQVREHVDYHGWAVVQSEPLVTQVQDHSVSARSQVWGIGPRAGFDVRYDIAAGVGLGAHAGVGVLAGGYRNDFFQHSVGQVPNSALSDTAFDEWAKIHNRQSCIVFPELDARLGVNYLSCSGRRYFMFVEGGYNLTTFINALHRLTFNNSGGANVNACRSFTLTGFYVSAKLRY